MAGYSGTPLAKKLGIKGGYRICFVNAPPDFAQEIELPSDITFLNRRDKALDLILFFARTQRELTKDFSRLADKLVPNGMLWIAWPKKASRVATDLSDNVVRRIGLEAGLVDVKVCAVNDVWSGLKFVYRVKDRPHA
jgi:hypothetical protein